MINFSVIIQICMQQMQKKTYQIKTSMKTKQSQKMSKNRAKIGWDFLR